MKRIIQLMAIAMLSLMFASSAHALSAGHNVTATTDATTNFNFPGVPAPGVAVAPNQMVSQSLTGVGDLLIYPLFVATEGATTKLTVVNTNRFASTVAKVVFRGYEESEEILDFYLYLSPADVWTGYVYYDAARDSIRVWSDDDSIRHHTGMMWANADNPFVHDVRELRGDAGELMNWMGYVTIFNVATYDQASDDNRANVNFPFANAGAQPRLGLQTLPADKVEIFNWFWGRNNLQLMRGDVGGIIGKEGAQIGKNRNILAGWMQLEINNDTPPFDGNPGAAASLRAAALQDFNASLRPALREDMQIRTASVMGPINNFTSLPEVEAILARQRVMMPYVHSDSQMSLHFFTFPTKYAQEGPLDIWGNRWPASWIFQAQARANGQCLTYGPGIFDRSEQFLDYQVSPFRFEFCTEVGFLDTGYLEAIFDPFFFDEGWIDYVFDAGATLLPTLNWFNPATGAWNPFANLIPGQAGLPIPNQVGDALVATGAPVIGTNLTFNAAGLTLDSAAYGNTYGFVWNAPGLNPAALTPGAGDTFRIDRNVIRGYDADGDVIDAAGSAGPGNVSTQTAN